MKPEEAFKIVLKKIRIQKKRSQEALALDSSLERSHIGLLERGQRTPNFSTLFKVAKGLGIPASKLVKAVETEMRSNKNDLMTKKKKISPRK